MSTQPGEMLSHYRLIEKIGEGGMGVVWKAIDTTLDREVAIKILPEAFADDPERLARFEREAKLLASLNHPSIAAIHGLEESDGLRFLVMELVPGENLAQRLSGGAIAVEDTLTLCRQITEALEAAHERGIIHRDLKPGNIRITPDGKVKVLDFGLAKALVTEPVSGDPSLSPTMTSTGTCDGMILGTAAYMSPEQARGKAVDKRTDLWSLGCVLYEMLTGKPLFKGDTVSDTLAAVLRAEPEWDALPAATPRQVRRVLRRCLEKDPARRLHDVADAGIELRDVVEGPAEADEPVRSVPPATPVWLRVLPWALTLVLAVFAVIAVQHRGSQSAVSAILPLTLAVPFPTDLTLPDVQMDLLALSPDGQSLAFVLQDDADQRLYLKRMNSHEVTALPGTHDATTPFFSPDAQWIAFFAENKLKKVSVQGGNPFTICDAVGSNRGATWGLDDRIVFSPHFATGLLQVSASGGEPIPLTTLDKDRNERTHRWPHAVPGEDLVLFTVQTLDSPEYYDDARIDALRPGSGERRTVLEGASLTRYAPSGHLVFAREGFLFAVPFDIDRLEVKGTPVPVVENVMGRRSSGIVYAAFSQNGLLAYVAGSLRTREGFLTWVGRDGRSERLPAPVNGYVNPRLSPDGKQIAVAIEGDAAFDIWTYDIDRETLTRLTFEGSNTVPVWSPDGKRIAFSSARGGQTERPYMKAADGSGEAHLLYSAEDRPNAGRVDPDSWSSDGRLLAMGMYNEKGWNILTLSMEDQREEVFLETPAAESYSDFSPDGRWIVYCSDETGNNEIYVRPFPGPGGKWQVSVDGGNEPYWTRDGREIFYRKGQRLLVVGVDTREGFRVGRPRVVFEGLPMYGGDRGYSVAADGQRVLFVEPADEERESDHVTVVVNWLDELRRRVPTRR